MTEQPYAGLLGQLVAKRPAREVAARGYVDSGQTTHINPDGPEAAEAISSLLNALENSRARFVGLATLIKAVTGHDSIMAQEAIEKIDAALNSDASTQVGGE
jgi:hypothetical protein